MATLKISDLSVGDWVLMNGEPAKALRLTMAGRTIFKGLSGQIYGSIGGDIFPLPIVPEILEKNGFEFEKASRWYICELEDKTRINVWIGRNNEGRIEVSKPDPFDDGYHFKYADIEVLNIAVHQLQHALRLAGVDKEINL